MSLKLGTMSEENNYSYDKILSKIAQEYASIFDIRCKNKRRQICEQISSVLQDTIGLKENTQHVSEMNKSLVQDKLPKIFTQYQELQQQFKAIDSLSAMVQRVTDDVTRLEGAVVAAEQQILGVHVPLSHRILQPVIRKLEPTPSNSVHQKAAFDSSLIFRPSDYLNTNCHQNNENNSSREEPVNVLSDVPLREFEETDEIQTDLDNLEINTT